MFEKIAAYLSDLLEIPLEDIRPESTFEDLGIDSLDMVEMEMALEETMDLRLPEDEVQEFANVGEFAAWVESKVG